MSQVLDLIDSLAPLAWPIILAIVLWRLFPVVRKILESRSFSIKAGSMEISGQEAAQQIQTQIDDLQKQVMLLRSGASIHEASLESAKPIPPAASKRSIRILWVDDEPKGNALQIAQLQDRGIDVVQAISTESAMSILDSKIALDGIISDMGRREGWGYHDQAGLALLNAVRQAGYKLPFLVYTSEQAATRYDKEVKAAGGDGATASPVELFEWIRRKVDGK